MTINQDKLETLFEAARKPVRQPVAWMVRNPTGSEWPQREQPKVVPPGWSCYPLYAAPTAQAKIPERGKHALDYTPGKLDRTVPVRIWLQINTNGDNTDRHEPWAGADGVTWNDESMGGLEIDYVRADIVASLVHEPNNEHD
ncbi:hypothetical protein [Xanthomonas albilineans]|uniref:hypothetical protein n=1 Tax=Xanthomonas albilineans TaxID=29447 RepID=UPI0006992471|nr:hypothetical protein [Xanthomonas albilineans]